MTAYDAISQAVRDGAAGKKVTVLVPTAALFNTAVEAIMTTAAKRALAPRIERVAGGRVEFEFGGGPDRVVVVNHSIPGMVSGIEFDGSAVVFWPERLPPPVASFLSAKADTVRYVR